MNLKYHSALGKIVSRLCLSGQGGSSVITDIHLHNRAVSKFQLFRDCFSILSWEHFDLVTRQQKFDPSVVKSKQDQAKSFVTSGIYHTCQKHEMCSLNKKSSKFIVLCCCVKYDYGSRRLMVSIHSTHLQRTNCEIRKLINLYYQPDDLSWLIKLNLRSQSSFEIYVKFIRVLPASSAAGQGFACMIVVIGLFSWWEFL